VRTGQADPPIDLGLAGTDLAATDGRAYVVSRGAGAVASAATYTCLRFNMVERQ